MRVLIVEDHPDLAANIGDYLSARACITDFAADGPEALRLARSGGFDVIVLDRMLPGLDGLTVCERLRREGFAAPILMLTAVDGVADRVVGLAAGADDYLVKPFAAAELLARLQALHRRASGALGGALRVGDLEYDPRQMRALRGGRELALNPTQRRLLECLMRASPAVVTHAQLENELWQDAPPESGALRTHVYLLRGIIDRGQPAKLLHTVHGEGYRLAVRP